MGEGEGGAGSRDEGAVAEESDSHRLIYFSSQTQITIIAVARSGPLPLPRRLWRVLGSDPYGRSAPSRSCLWSERHARRFPIPVVAGRGQKSVRRSGSRPLLDRVREKYHKYFSKHFLTSQKFGKIDS